MLRTFHRVDSEDLGIGDEHALGTLAVADIHGNFLEQFHYLVGVRGEIDTDVDGGHGVIACSDWRLW